MENIKRHQTELGIKITDKHLTVDHVLERTPKNFSIKGNTAVNVASDLSKFSLNNYDNRFSIDGHHVYYKAIKNGSTGWAYWLNGNKTTFQDDKTYTMTYICHKCTKNVSLRIYTANINVYFSKEPGLHHFSFTASKGWNSGNVHFLCSEMARPTEGDPEDEFHYEILSCVEGTEPAPRTMKGIHPIGTVDGINIVTQEEAPVLGEYELQGDIVDVINSIEDEIVKNKDVFEVTWI